MPRRNNAEEKREAILNAFGLLLTQKMPDRIKLRELSEVSGVPYGSLHFFFKDKNEILLAYAERILNGYLEAAEQWSAHIDTEIADFHTFYKAYLEFVESNFRYEREAQLGNYEHYFSVVHNSAALATFSAELTGRYVEVLADAIRRTRLECKEPRKLACILVALTDGISTLTQMDFPSGDRLELLRYFAELI